MKKTAFGNFNVLFPLKFFFLQLLPHCKHLTILAPFNHPECSIIRSFTVIDNSLIKPKLKKYER